MRSQRQASQSFCWRNCFCWARVFVGIVFDGLVRMTGLGQHLSYISIKTTFKNKIFQWHLLTIIVVEMILVWNFIFHFIWRDGKKTHKKCPIVEFRTYVNLCILPPPKKRVWSCEVRNKCPYPLLKTIVSVARALCVCDDLL